MWSATRERFDKIDAAAADAGESGTVRNLCKLALELIRRPDLSYNRTDHKPLLDTIAAGGIIDQTLDADVLDALADSLVSRGVELGWGRVMPWQVKEARAL